ncbi:alpha/beta fold hydrolase [Stutzerimonas degradans]|jgi:pimeloyl-ACP methyl ester carboxylesterase|uniref:Alpha/beta hydrolase n=1 Tax=Stutzerimonas degradans TaxID=2968968 RepID=A0A8E2QDM5_9GAMM|nr:alpha/beta hydrolase [Stutzerimonas degradans]MDT3710167.1 alpha/beta hydrolase [Pseudomonadaceae bacterium]MCQ4267766.1 alpha/beta hydrolase [Stutzerimonas degradans]MCQ4276007.1 alpha/beta hydrolase [Stutzerimonas degradans]PNF76441.1 alpha/beta hydrolase [Stutzerimonas degradans]QPT22790.1 alpha/beta hydrolase [Stutzerimonas degradans]
MSTVKKTYVDVAHGQIHLRYVAGRQTVPTVFLHQTASSSAMYQAVMEQLGDLAPLYALDTPGFGGSYRPPVVPTTDYYVRTLLEAIDALGIERFNLFGHHTGAALACQLAAQHPQRVRRLAMIGPVQLTEQERSLWRDSAVKPLTIDDHATHLAEVWQRVTHLDQQPITYPPSTALATREAIDTLIAGDRWHEAYAAVFAQDFPAWLAQVDCPLLLICGDGDVLHPYFQRACQARPDAEVLELEAGAYVLDQQPQYMAQVIRTFFQQAGTPATTA